MTDTAPPTETFLSGGAGRILARQWAPAGTPRASLVICHGFNAHSGHYLRAAEAFARSGLAVTALDLRGRGRSEGERFYVESIEDYVSDLGRAIELARSTHPDLPLYLLGHSAGGVTAVSCALDGQHSIDGLICESFAFRAFAPDFALKLLEGADHLVPHLHVLKLKNADFSRDPEWVAALDADPLTQGEVQPIASVAALTRAAERLEREFGRFTLPVLILHGTADRAARPDGSQQYFDEAASTDKALKLYEGHYHDLLNDLGREEVSNDILAWIAARTAPPELLPQMPHPAA